MLYTIPKEIHVNDVTIVTTNIDTSDQSATIDYDVRYELSNDVTDDVQCTVEVIDQVGNSRVAKQDDCQGTNSFSYTFPNISKTGWIKRRKMFLT